MNLGLVFFGLEAGVKWALYSFFGSGFVKGKMNVLIWGGDET